MKLREYLKNRKKRAFFSETLSITEVSINNYICGRRLPRKDIIRKIYFETQGKVTPSDIYNVNQWKQELKQLKSQQKQLKKETISISPKWDSVPYNFWRTGKTNTKTAKANAITSRADHPDPSAPNTHPHQAEPSPINPKLREAPNE
jgi:hypothetical protein